MKNEPYAIGLDIGTSSLGWANTDMDGYISRVKGQTGLGVRLFEEGQAAEERRGFRTTRRRLSRRRWRLRLLREIFDEPISSLDPNFFARQKASNLSPKDQRFRATYQLFSDLSDQEFYTKYPTIYHLRWALMTEHRKFDLREIYLAVHHIVKYRGNFLRKGNPEKFKPSDLNFGKQFAAINESWRAIFHELAPQLPKDNLNEIETLVLDTSRSRLDRQRKLVKLLMAATDEHQAWKPYLTEVAKAILGLKTKLFLLTGNEVAKADEKTWTFSLNDIEDHRADLEAAFDDTSLVLIEKLVDLQAAVQLTEIMPSGQYFSQSMVQSYETHAKHLQWLKDYAKQQTDDKKKQAIRLAYDHYVTVNEKGKAETAADFYKDLNKVLKGDSSELATKISREIDLEHFMPKQRTKGNGVIPYQVHQQELDLIINNQKEYYSFLGTKNPVTAHLKTQRYQLDELVSFRVPYYVGPMVTASDQTTEGKFSWMVRKDTEDTGEITPWNFDDKVDRTASATNFIQRMKTTDTYLIGEDVLPLQSLTYQRFMVLNELNNVRVNEALLSRDQKQRIYNQVFKGHGTVSVKALQDNLIDNSDVATTPKIEGLADPKHFNSALTTYRDFRKFLPKDIDREDRRADIEKIINWSTIFEDAEIFKAKLQEISWLTDNQRQRISNKRYRGWGRLSQRLLTEIKDEQGLSIMDQLWRTQHNFMQIVHEPDYAKAVEKVNAAGMAKQDVFDTINEMYTSPQNKKALRQILLVVRDIQKAHHGQAPSRIFIEAARGADQNPQRSRQRQKQLSDLFADRAKAIVDDTVVDELKSKIDDKAAFTDRLMLYFLQNGRDMYTGDRIDIDRLSMYDIDHILPQSLIKDDSLDNRVLVNQRINREKNDVFASELYANSMRGTWNVWRSAGMISARKLKHLLMRPDEIDKYATGFVNRQLVETRQVIKLVTDILSTEYDPQKTKLISVKAGLSHQLRQELKLPKLRNLNDYHHAFDAFLAARIGTYLLKRYPKLERFFVFGQYKVAPQLNLRQFNFIHDLVAGKQDRIVNQETGEILWDRSKDINYMKHFLSLKHLLVTHEVLENRGALFNQTIYKAKEDNSNVGGKRKLLPAKQNRPTEIYGGYSGQNIAYLAIVKVHEKTDYLKVMGVPIRCLTDLKAARQQGKQAEKDLLKKIFLPEFTKKSGKTTDFEMLDSHIYLHQRIRDVVYGKKHEFALGTNTYYRNLQQLVLPLGSQQVLLSPRSSSDELVKVYDEICTQAMGYFSLYDRNKFRQSLVDHRDNFVGLPRENQVDEKGKIVQVGQKVILQRIMVGLHANASRSDLKPIQINTPFGFLQSGKGIQLTLDAEVIHESPTGLFREVNRLDNA
ncbi:type II CRISPR RNA-guided endonuclease Cas9 [Levilactobacillus wangkuiensis]|uniref:type II CRISPR RNA-guided endonuclease Cas9 n=1 Tax=Levilactobacillus wangkuiensis TaxID=2799566 RepID=UPI001EECB2B6|nr:type II CRISPR RNA-guided endonuclease Cas9 [Levilactobacillus wangkuiensis]